MSKFAQIILVFLAVLVIFALGDASESAGSPSRNENSNADIKDYAMHDTTKDDHVQEQPHIDIQNDGPYNSKAVSEEIIAEMQEKFREYDKDQDGYLNFEEVKMISDDILDEEVREFFQEVDTNKDGKVDINEFVEAGVQAVQESQEVLDLGMMDGDDIDFATGPLYDEL